MDLSLDPVCFNGGPQHVLGGVSVDFVSKMDTSGARRVSRRLRMVEKAMKGNRGPGS